MKPFVVLAEFRSGVFEEWRIRAAPDRQEEERREQEELARNGQPLALEIPAGEPETGGRDCYRAYTLDGLFLGVLRFNPKNGCWHPKRVFR